jgi:hypothetical protein
MGSVAILLTGNGTGELGRVVPVLGCFQRLPEWLPTHYAPWQRNRCRRTINRLASAQVTSRRCVFFFSPR